MKEGRVVYRWREGSRVGLNADLVARELEAVERAHGGLEPATVVEFAKDPETELHRGMEWDDGVAAVRYREAQARTITRDLILVEVVEGDDAEPPRSVNVYHHVASQGAYRNVRDVAADADLLAEVLDTAKRELGGFRRKYADLRELSAVVEAIGEVLD